MHDRCKCKWNYKTFRRNIEKNIWDLQIGGEFLEIDTKNMIHKRRKINQLDFIKIQSCDL